MLINEKQFDKNLNRIGELYEHGKDLLHGLLLLEPSDQKSRSEIYEVLREMRDLAAVNLKRNHEIKDN